ncbi:cGMP-dependent protein kinase [Aureococcus anophagefferens]|uniref:cGMP-dependent protein kinase n=3 Tax=Aureococcus anophagefferens TaxID=44056 RepID=A0ABR1G8X3_AURAN
MKDQLAQVFNGLSEHGEQQDWLSAKDVSPDDAVKELARLRQLAAACVNAKHAGKRVKDELNLDHYKAKKANLPPEIKSLITSVMDSNILFKRCKAEEKEELLANFEACEYASGEVIIKAGDQGDCFYIIQTGSCDIFLPNNEVPVAKCTAGNSFGELALMYDTPRAATVKSTCPVKAWKIARQAYRLILAYHAVQRSNEHMAILKEVVLVSSDQQEKKMLKDCLSEPQLRKLADAMDEDIVHAGDAILREGEIGDTFYVIADGRVQVETKHDGIVTTLEKGGYFGDRALISEDRRAATCTAIGGDVKLLAIDRDDFLTLLGSVQEIMSAGGTCEETKNKQPVIKRVNDKITKADLKHICPLGQGAFGKVTRVMHTSTETHYALKAQAKSAIVEQELQNTVLQEREVLMQLDHPFVLKLACAFQDDKYIYFLLELLPGGELYKHMTKRKRFTEPETKFFASSVILGFQHMHEKNMAYRDLKPENLVLDAEGFLKVVDLGLAKMVEGKTFTMCGTPDYLSPEVILNEGHDKSVDYWALGVLLFEFVNGVPPFCADEPMRIFDNILSNRIKMPSHFGRHLSDIIRKFCKSKPSARLGNGRKGFGAIKKHRFFSGFPWTDLLEHNKDKITPPIEVSDSYELAPEEDFLEPYSVPDWNPNLGE